MKLKKLLLMLTFFVLMGTTAFAQSLLYVDVTNGSDAYTGVNATNNPAGTGPKATFAAARALVTNGGTIVIKAGTYAEAFDMSTGLIAATNSYTVQLSQLNANDVVDFTGGATVINKAGLTVNIVTTVGTEKITQTNAALNITSGSINLSAASAWVLPNGATITLAGTSGFTNAAPSKTTNISLVYTGGSSFTAGSESNYGSYGTGTITVNKTAGTTVTFANAITAVAGIVGTAGNATFSAAVTLGANDITNNGTGTLTFNGAVAFSMLDAVTAADIGSVVNASTGSVVFNSSATWSSANITAVRVYPAAATTYVIDNQLTGSILFNAGTTFVADPTTGFFNSTVTAINNAGTLTLGTVTAATANAVSVIVNVINSTAAGTLNVAGKLDGNLTTGNATATTNIVGATTVAGIFTNAGTTALGGNNLTLSGNSPHVTVGGTVTASTGGIIVTAGAGVASFNGGTLSNVTNNGAVNTTISAAATFTSLTATAGTVTVGAAITVGTLTINGGTVTDGAVAITATTFNQSAGTLTLVVGSTLDVKGNFNRTGGTFTAPAGSLVSFTGSGAQSVNGGPLFQVGNLTFNNAGGIITVGNSIRAQGAIIIATATNVDFSTTNLVMNGGAATSTITNNGTYTAIGGGGVVVGGINTIGPVGGVIPGGVAGGVAGATYRLQGTGTYSYITVDVGAGNLAEVVTTVTGVKWNGVLTLRSGTLDIATAGVDFGPTGSVASIVRYPEDSPGITTSAGTFNAANVSYDLTYTGAITGNKAVGTEITATPANVRTWTIQTTGAFLNTLVPTTSLNFGGTLIIENGATLNIPTNIFNSSFTLSGASKNHIIRGTFNTVDAADNLTITGANSTITGSATTTHAASIGHVVFNATGLVVSDIFAFTGTVTANAGSTVTLGMGTATARRQITGLLTSGGASLTLTTPIILNAGAAHTAGTFDFGANLVTLATGGNWLQTGGSYASTGGYLQFDIAGALTLTSALPYLRVNDVIVTLGAAATISQNLDITGATPAGTITSAGNNLTLQNTMTTNGGPVAGVFSGAGNLILAGAPTTITASASTLISNVTVNTTGTATLASSSSTARTFTIGGALTHTAGDLALGINSVSLTGAGAAYTRATATGQITQGTGELRFEGAAAQTAAQGTGFTIPNLTINNATVGTPDVTFAGGATNDFTVTGTLRLTTGDLSSTAAGKLHIGNLATIERFATVSLLTQVPTFDGDVNITYRGATAATMANEMPTAASAKLNNLVVNMAAGGNTLATAAAVAFKGTATLTQGILNNTGGAITAASGATINYNGGTLGQAPTLTNYNLTYSASYGTTTTEFRNGAGISVDLLTVSGAATVVNLGQDRTVKNFTLASGTFNTGVNTLTTTGDVNVSAGTFTSAGGALVFGGTTAQTFTVPATQTLGGNLTINNATGVTLAGGNLTMNAGQTVTFTSGVLTTGSNWIQFAHAANTQGFTRTGGWVNGNVRHAITAGAGSPTVYANGRYEFPVGTPTRFRPYAITFSSTSPAINPTNIIVGMVDSSPLGTLNVDAGNGLKIAGYPAYYWLVTANPSSFTSTQLFDVELTGTNIGIPYTSDQNLRIVRRQDGAAEYNPWSLQNGSTYANYSVISGTDTTAVVRTTSSIGGIVTQGTRFSIGVPARVPTFGATATTFTVAEGATTANTLQVTATAQNAGETITGYTKVSGPTWAALSTTGLLTFTPGYTDFSATAYPVVVRATSSTGLTADLTVNVTVTNTNRAPSFTGGTVVANQEIPYGVAKTFQYAAKDEDNETLTYSVNVTPASAATGADAPTIASALGNAAVLTWKPAFADLNKEFVVTVTVKDAANSTATTSATIKVIGSYARGNATLTGGVDIDDAIAVLKHVVGNPSLSAEALIPADANLDGTVNAVDASWILKFIAGGVWVAPKVAATAGNVEFGRLAGENSVYNLPINVTSTSGVTAVYAEVDVNGVDIKNVSARLPQGWLSSYAIENGKIKFAAAGVTPLTDGTVANIELKLNSKETVVSVVGNAKLNEEVTSLLNAKVREIPSEFALSQNYPNPFNPTTSIKFQVAQDAKVSLVVYDMLGQRVRTLVDGIQDAGFYTVRWDGSNDFGGKVSSGVYIYRLQAGNFVSTMKMNLMK